MRKYTIWIPESSVPILDAMYREGTIITYQPERNLIEENRDPQKAKEEIRKAQKKEKKVPEEGDKIIQFNSPSPEETIEEDRPVTRHHGDKPTIQIVLELMQTHYNRIWPLSDIISHLVVNGYAQGTAHPRVHDLIKKGLVVKIENNRFKLTEEGATLPPERVSTYNDEVA